MHQNMRTDIGEISRSFNATISDVLKIAEQQSDSDEEVTNIDRLRKRINLLRGISPSTPLEYSAHYFIEHSKQIQNRDEEFFLGKNAKDVWERRIGQTTANLSENQYVFELVEMMKHRYRMSSNKTKDDFFTLVTNMLVYSIEYMCACAAAQQK